MWVQGANAAVTFYQGAFDAVVLHRVGDGDDIVAQLGVRDARFWVTEANENMKRYSPRAIGGTTGRTLLVVDEPEAFLRQAVTAGASETASVCDEHGWRLGRIVDPFGNEWEIGRPLDNWPPSENGLHEWFDDLGVVGEASAYGARLGVGVVRVRWRSNVPRPGNEPVGRQ